MCKFLHTGKSRRNSFTGLSFSWIVRDIYQPRDARIRSELPIYFKRACSRERLWTVHYLFYKCMHAACTHCLFLKTLYHQNLKVNTCPLFLTEKTSVLEGSHLWDGIVTSFKGCTLWKSYYLQSLKAITLEKNLPLISKVFDLKIWWQ